MKPPLLTLAPTTTGGSRSITDPSSGKAAPLMALGICRTFCLIMAPLFSTWKRPLFDKYDPGMFQSGCLLLASVFSLIHICIDKTGKNPMGPWNLEASTSGGIILVIWGIQILAWVIRFMVRKVSFDRTLVALHIPIYFYENSSQVLPDTFATSIMHVWYPCFLTRNLRRGHLALSSTIRACTRNCGRSTVQLKKPQSSS